MIIRLEEAKPIHVHEILRNLREHDRPTFGKTEDPAEALLGVLRKSSESFVWLVDGEVVCLWGAAKRTILADAVYLWMINTPWVEEHPFTFVRHAQITIKRILDEYGQIEGNVWTSNAVAMKWVKWLGAELVATPVDGELEFRLRRESHPRWRA